MFEKICKMKNKKGFTLVELIVVLVILAILAALLIPALTGYIDKANKEKVVAECRQVVMAAQSELSEAYGKADYKKGDTIGTKYKSAIDTLGEVKNTWSYNVKINNADGKVGQVVEVTFWDGSYGCTYYDGQYYIAGDTLGAGITAVPTAAVADSGTVTWVS